LKFQLCDLGYEFPRYPVPDDETMDSFLRKRVEEGVVRRYGPKRNSALLERARKQVTHELALIAKLGFAGYFLIVWDIVRFCKRNGILIQGRGSAANSAVCYALEITAVDPVEMDLLFERFLSENRGEWPDIDLDLPSEEKREQAIQYVYQRYGELGAAMTANVITYRGKSAAREVGKALGFDANSLQRLSALVEALPGAVARRAVLTHHPAEAGPLQPGEHHQVEQQDRVGGARGEDRAAERDDAVDEVRAATGEASGHQAAEAVPHDRDLAPALERDRLDAPLESLGRLEGAADVGVHGGAVGAVAQGAQVPGHQPQGAVAGQETRNEDHRVAGSGPTAVASAPRAIAADFRATARRARPRACRSHR